MQQAREKQQAEADRRNSNNSNNNMIVDAPGWDASASGKISNGAGASAKGNGLQRILDNNDQSINHVQNVQRDLAATHSGEMLYYPEAAAGMSSAADSATDRWSTPWYGSLASGSKQTAMTAVTAGAQSSNAAVNSTIGSRSAMDDCDKAPQPHCRPRRTALTPQASTTRPRSAGHARNYLGAI